MAAVAPNITVAGTLMDPSGNALAGAKLLVQLCSFSSQLPRVALSGIIAQIRVTPVISGTGTYSFSLYGNDQITPVGSYYLVTVKDANDNVIQSDAFLFTGGVQNVDLSTWPIFLPDAPEFAGYFSQAPVGAINGVNTLYSLPFLIDPTQLLLVFYNGNSLRQGVDFVVLGGKVTLSFAPATGENLWFVGVTPGVLVPFGLPSTSEQLRGVIDGANKVFYTSRPPSILPLLLLFENGLFQRPGIEYTVTSNQITMTNAPLANANPQYSDNLWATYPN